MTWQIGLAGFLAGLLISIVTSPVGVSGAVFLLPVQLSVLHVPSPAVTPTNLLFNVVAAPGALARYRRNGQLTGPLARLLITGTVPGVVLGAIIRVHAIPGPQIFRLLGLLCGVGGLIGGYLGARLQPHLPERALRLLLGTLATGLGVLYLIQGLHPQR